MASTIQTLELSEIQGLAISGYGHLKFAGYLFLQFGSAESGKTWLNGLAPRVSNASIWSKDANGKTIKPKHLINVGITYKGLLALGIPENGIENPDLAFKDGITSSRRIRILGDKGASAPETWEIGGTGEADALHAVLIVLGDSAEARDTLVLNETAEFEKMTGNVVLHVQKANVLPEDKEHFGFRDGIAQPALEDGIRKTDVSEVRVMNGEFVLGYHDEYSRPDSGEKVPPPTFCIKGVDIGRNGSYLVFRKLHQNVASFWNYMATQIPLGNEAMPDEVNAMSDYQKLIWVASKAVGRWPSGVPLTLSPTKDDPAFAAEDKINRFLYNRADDKYGYLTPVGSHIRRSNPRNLNSSGDPMPDSTPEERGRFTANRHQIIRRGMPFGKMYHESFSRSSIFELLEDMMKTRPFTPLQDDGQDRGLIFFCINANIPRQFEFIQQSWLNNTKFHKLYNDKDPITGDNPDFDADEETRRKHDYQMKIEMSPLRRRMEKLQRFVTVKGGGYFFMPSISAIQQLATGVTG